MPCAGWRSASACRSPRRSRGPGGRASRSQRRTRPRRRSSGASSPRPAADARGKVIAFGGRILPGRPATGDPPPKYLNSAESPIFRKGQTLYGIPQARDGIRRAGRAIVVEGYLDVIALSQAGIGEVVAPL